MKKQDLLGWWQDFYYEDPKRLYVSEEEYESVRNEIYNLDENDKKSLKEFVDFVENDVLNRYDENLEKVFDKARTSEEFSRMSEQEQDDFLRLNATFYFDMKFAQELKEIKELKENLINAWGNIKNSPKRFYVSDDEFKQKKNELLSYSSKDDLLKFSNFVKNDVLKRKDDKLDKLLEKISQSDYYVKADKEEQEKILREISNDYLNKKQQDLQENVAEPEIKQETENLQEPKNEPTQNESNQKSNYDNFDFNKMWSFIKDENQLEFPFTKEEADFNNADFCARFIKEASKFNKKELREFIELMRAKNDALLEKINNQSNNEQLQNELSNEMKENQNLSQESENLETNQQNKQKQRQNK